MDSKYILSVLILFAYLISSMCGCQCTPDIYGDNIILEVPFNIEIQSDTISGGDTIWMFADFSKDVLEKKSGQGIVLENFPFFTELSISEISDTFQNFSPVSVFSDVGSIEVLPLITAISYPIMYEEAEERYEFRGGIIVPEQQGLYVMAFSSSNLLFEENDHPALFQCGNDHRSVVNVAYKNEFTTLSNFENIFLNTQISFFLERSTFEGYQSGGSVAFYVR